MNSSCGAGLNGLETPFLYCFVKDVEKCSVSLSPKFGSKLGPFWLPSLFGFGFVFFKTQSHVFQTILKFTT